MEDNYKDLWAPTSRKERDKNKEKASEFLNEKSIESKHAIPPFDETKVILANIENKEERRKELEKLIGLYELTLAELDQKRIDYENKHASLFVTGNMDEERHRVEQAINQIHTELQYYRTRLQHNDLDFSRFKKPSLLKKLYAPFGTKDAALYTGLSVYTINKNPEEYGADMSTRPYKYSPEKLDIVLNRKGLTSPYWEYPELVVRSSSIINEIESEISGPRKILWKGKSPDTQLPKLIDFWVKNGYIDLHSDDIGKYIDERFTIDEEDRSPGRFINWMGGQKELIAYLDNLEDHNCIVMKGIGESTYLNKFIMEHILCLSKDGSFEPFKPGSLTTSRATVSKIYRNPGKSEDKFTSRAIEILNEIQKIVDLEES